MAMKKEVIIGVIIGFAFLIFIGFFGLIFIGALYSDDGLAMGGFGEKIAVIEVYGAIYDSSDTIRQLKKFGESNSVKAIILHIDFINIPPCRRAPSQHFVTLHVKSALQTFFCLPPLLRCIGCV